MQMISRFVTQSGILSRISSVVALAAKLASAVSRCIAGLIMPHPVGDILCK